MAIIEPVIIKEGNGFLVVEKPSGMSIHNEPGKDLISVVSEKLISDSRAAGKTGFKNGDKPSPVNRLDSQTSGIVILSWDKEILKYFGLQFLSGRVTKKYTAIVHGHFHEDLNNKKNIWDYPLTKKHGGRSNPAGSGKKVQCRTYFRILRESEHYSLLEIDLDTGRKHQIRRHAKLAGSPILYDKRYGTEKSALFLETRMNFNRLALHSYYLKIKLPDGVEYELMTEQKIPDSFKALLKQDTSIL